MRILVATVALAAFVAGCATPPPTRTPSQTPFPLPTPGRSPSAVSPAPSTPSPTPVPAVDLTVEATVRQSCGSIGGCAYYLTIEGDGGSWRAELGGRGADGVLHGAAGLPSTIPIGIYTLTLSSYMISDAILNGVRQEFGPDAICWTSRTVRSDQPLRIVGTFDGDACLIAVSEWRGVPLGNSARVDSAPAGSPTSTP